MTDSLELQLPDAVTLAVPATLQSITTYVLLEQERWFEKEMEFLRCFLRPGMTVIDLGANLGVYSVPIARLVGQTGHVFAYEPGAEPRALLEVSRKLSGVPHLTVVPFALSDRPRDGRLLSRGSSELAVLAGDAEDAAGEAVRVTSLDHEDAAHRWRSPDFVKIDTEGEEERIIAGGRQFFARHSPLVMFELRKGTKVIERPRELFPRLGYRLFRQLAGAPILVPDDETQPLDGFELNLFAAKPDRAQLLAEQGLLVETIPPWTPGAESRATADTFWQEQSFISLINVANLKQGVDPEYGNGLVAYAVWRTENQPLDMRCAALASALRSIRAACAHRPSLGRLSTLARVAWEWGARSESVAALHHLIKSIDKNQNPFTEAFLPAHPRFDTVAPTQPGQWFAAAAAEQFEQSFSFSSAFGGASPILAWLCAQPFASSEMQRRRMLVALGSGERLPVPTILREARPDHLNARLWSSGAVPGTLVGPLTP